jgi:hypothetical protein
VTTATAAYHLVRATALAVRCPIAQCRADTGSPCVVSGETPADYHLSRLDHGLLAEYPELRDERDQRRADRRRWRAAV